MGVLKWGCFPDLLLVFPGLLAIHWSYSTRHMNEISTHFCLVLLQKQATKCSTPEVYPILSQTHQEHSLGDFPQAVGNCLRASAASDQTLQNKGFQAMRTDLGQFPRECATARCTFPFMFANGDTAALQLD